MDQNLIIRNVQIPIDSGYLQTTIKHESYDEEQLERNDLRSSYWGNITSCPKCGGSEIFKYHEVSSGKYYVKCENAPRSVYADLESIIVSRSVKKSTSRSSSTDVAFTPLRIPSGKKIDMVDIVDQLQERICGCFFHL